MTTWNIIAVLFIILAGGIIIAIKMKQNKDKIDFDSFLDMYGNDIITILQDSIKILKVSMDSFPTREEYENEIIITTISILKNNAEKFGISSDVIKLIDTESLAKLIRTVFDTNYSDCFKCLSKKTIIEHRDLIDIDVSTTISSNDIPTGNMPNTKNSDYTE